MAHLTEYSEVSRFPDSADVITVSLGPTGAKLANLLAKCGIGVTVVDREAGIYDLAGAVHFDGETMRVSSPRVFRKVEPRSDCQSGHAFC